MKTETHIERYARLRADTEVARTTESAADDAATVKAGKRQFVKVCPAGTPGFWLVTTNADPRITRPTVLLTPKELRAFAVRVIDLVDERLPVDAQEDDL